MSLRLRELSSERELTLEDVRNPLVCGPSLTKQEFKGECDINNIIARFHRDGFTRHLARGVPQFVDVSLVPDFRTAIEQVRAAEKFFGGLPAKVRARFGNDAARYLDEAGSLSREELRELGMAELRAEDVRRRSSDVEAPPVPEGGGGV